MTIGESTPAANTGNAVITSKSVTNADILIMRISYIIPSEEYFGLKPLSYIMTLPDYLVKSVKWLICLFWLQVSPYRG
jgi:hypothetical protein